MNLFLMSPFLQRQFIPVNFRRVSFWWFIAQYAFMYLGSLFVIICLSFFLLGSWDYLPSVYGFMWVEERHVWRLWPRLKEQLLWLRPVAVRAGNLMFQAGHRSHSRGQDISVTPRGNFSFGKNIHLDSKISWFDFGGQRSKVKVCVTSQNVFLATTHKFKKLIMTQFNSNMFKDKMKWWHFISKRSKVNFTVTS